MRALFILIIISLSLQTAFAQDPAISQFTNNSLSTNPAYAGINQNFRLGMAERMQWHSITSPFSTQVLWGDFYMPPLMHGGVGFVLMNDISGEGLLRTSQVSIMPSFSQTLWKRNGYSLLDIRMGFNITYGNKHVNWSRLTFSDQLNPIGNVSPSSVTPVTGAGSNYLDFGSGFMVDFNSGDIGKTNINADVGFAINHLNKPKDGLSGNSKSFIPIKTTIHFRSIIEVETGRNQKVIGFSPLVIYEAQQEFKVLNVGMFLMFDEYLSLGMLLRTRKFIPLEDHESVIISFLIKNVRMGSGVFHIGLNYDFTTNKLNNSNTNGSHEVSIIYELSAKRYYRLFWRNSKKKKSKYRSKCQTVF